MKYTEIKFTDEGIYYRFPSENSIEKDYQDHYELAVSGCYEMFSEIGRKRAAGEDVFPYQYSSVGAFLLKLAEDLARRLNLTDSLNGKCDAQFLQTLWFACGNGAQIAENLSKMQGVKSVTAGFVEGEERVPYHSLTGEEICGKTPGLKVVYDALCVSAEDIIEAFLKNLKDITENESSDDPTLPCGIFYDGGLNCHCMEANKKIAEINDGAKHPLQVTVQYFKSFSET